MSHPLPTGFRSWDAPLSAIASAVVGESVTVCWRDYLRIGGATWRTAHGLVVALSDKSSLEYTEHTFWHELGHVLLKHVNVISAVEPDLDQEHITVQLSLSQAAAAAEILPIVEQRETAADIVGEKLAQEFEQRFGCTVLKLFITSA